MGVIENLVDQAFGKSITTDTTDHESKMSVVIPIGPNEYSSELLEKVFNSVKSQNYKGAKEIIAVCNGCPDYIRNVANEMADIYLNFDDPLGYSGARNAGAKKATGDTTIFMDADTKMTDTETLHKIAESIESGYVGGTTRLVPDKETCGETSYFEWTNMVGKYVNKARNMPFIGKMVPAVGNGALIFYRTDLGLEFNTDKKNNEDTALFREMGKYGKIDFLDDCHVETSGRRVRENGAAKSWLYRAQNWLEEHEDSGSETNNGTPGLALAA